VTAAAAIPAVGGREALPARQVLEQFRKVIGSTRGLMLTAVPRAGLQVMQPANVSEALIKAYAKDFHAEDRLSWQAILRGKPTRAEDAWPAKELDASVYASEWMKPNELRYVVAVPLQSPVFEGYPGVVHLGRTAGEGSFTNAELGKLADLADSIDKRVASARGGTTRKPSRRNGGGAGLSLSRPSVRMVILDGQLKPKLPTGGWSDLDERLQNHIVDQARRRQNQVNGEAVFVDRVLLPDTHGDSWTFRVTTHKNYPALGDGAFSIFCLQPDCTEWGAVRPADFQADAELTRLLPSLKYMQQEFAKGPTLVDIARQVDLSPFHFHRRFTELLGMTPKQYLLNCQIYQAKADLLAREKELVQIAKECGFAHQSHFTSRFKQATGLTPTRWRRMATAKTQAADK
jgi:AraC-like DNA-binding protein